MAPHDPPSTPVNHPHRKPRGGSRHAMPSDPDAVAGLTEALHGLNVGRSPPRTPGEFQPQTRARTHLAEQPPGAPQPHRSHRVVRGNGIDQFKDRRILPEEVLLEKLVHCEPNTNYSATLNKAAEREKYHHIPWKTVNWETEALENGKSFDELFVRAVTHYESQVASGRIEKWDKVQYYPQKDKLLQLEGDVADSNLTNVLNPSNDIYNQFIHPSLQSKLQCVIRSQHEAHSSKLDHAIYLVETIPVRGKDYDLQIPLVIVEEKAPGIIKRKDWVHDHHRTSEDHPQSAMNKLLPQLLLYAQRAQCHRLFLTNYNETMAVRVDLGHLHFAATDLLSKKPKQPHLVEVQVKSATHEYEGDSIRHPCDYGFRMGLASEVFLALVDLGIANFELIDKELHTHDIHKTKIHRELIHFLDDYDANSRRKSHSPSAQQQERRAGLGS